MNICYRFYKCIFKWNLNNFYIDNEVWNYELSKILNFILKPTVYYQKIIDKSTCLILNSMKIVLQIIKFMLVITILYLC